MRAIYYREGAQDLIYHPSLLLKRISPYGSQNRVLTRLPPNKIINCSILLKFCAPSLEGEGGGAGWGDTDGFKLLG